VRTYAEHLYDWFDTLEQSQIDWDQVELETIAAYRNRMLENRSSHTDRPYARATINDRVGTVCRFYSWARQRHLIKALPFHLVDVRRVRSTGFLSRPATVKANILTVARHEKLPRPLRPDELRRLFAALSTPYRLVAEWALATGVRRKELCGLMVPQIPDVSDIDPGEMPLIGVPLTITKGDRPRTIYPPLRLVDRTHWYIGEERAIAARQRSGRRSTALFLTGQGNPVTRQRLTAVFGEAFEKARIPGSLHWLRHTFAMTMLVQLQRHAASGSTINPLKVVQVLLGHASIETTAIYLRCVELHERDLAESIAFLYGAVIDDGA
jgi:site-specific recombinase XerD